MGRDVDAKIEGCRKNGEVKEEEEEQVRRRKEEFG